MTITGINFGKSSIISHRGVDLNQFGIAIATVLFARHFVDLALDIATKVKKIRKNRVVVCQGTGAGKWTKVAVFEQNTGNFLGKEADKAALNTDRKPCDNEVNSNQMLSL